MLCRSLVIEYQWEPRPQLFFHRRRLARGATLVAEVVDIKHTAPASFCYFHPNCSITENGKDSSESLSASKRS